MKLKSVQTLACLTKRKLLFPSQVSRERIGAEVVFTLIYSPIVCVCVLCGSDAKLTDNDNNIYMSLPLSLHSEIYIVFYNILGQFNDAG